MSNDGEYIVREIYVIWNVRKRTILNKDIIFTFTVIPIVHSMGHNVYILHRLNVSTSTDRPFSKRVWNRLDIIVV